MSRGFYTQGTGATDIITTGYTGGVPALSSWFIWNIYNSAAFTGRMFNISEASTGAGMILGVYDSTNFRIMMGWTSFGDWTWASPVISGVTFHSLGFSYNSGSSSNVPLVYQDGVNPSVSTSSSPSGSFSSGSGSALTIGNRASDLARAWDGALAAAAMWNVVLTDLEFFALCKGAQPWTIRRGSLIAYLPLDGLASPEPDYSGNKYNGTVSGALKRFGPPMVPFTRRWPLIPEIVTPAAPEILMPAIQL